MNNKLYNIVKIVVGLLGLIGVILLVRVVMTGDETLTTDLDAQAGVVDPFVTFTIVMLIITAVLAVVFSIWSLVKNPVALKKALLTLAVLGGLFGLAFVLSSDAAVTDTYGQILPDGGAAGIIPKRVGTLIKYTYILGIIGVICVAWGSVKGLFSNK